jgi:hypothetical protein
MYRSIQKSIKERKGGESCLLNVRVAEEEKKMVMFQTMNEESRKRKTKVMVVCVKVKAWS